MTIRKQSFYLVFLLLALSTICAFAQEKDPEHEHKSPHSSEELAKINREYDLAWAKWQKSFAQSDYFAPGMVVADLGAGKGELALLLAERVGPDGQVIANEIDGRKISALESLCKKNSVTNVSTLLGKENDPLIPDNKVDVALMVEVFHHLADQSAFLDSTFKRLKPGSIFLIVEADIHQEGGTKDGCYSDPDEARAVAEKAGFTFVKHDWFTIRDTKFFTLVVQKPVDK